MKTMKFPIDLSMLTEEEIDQFRQDPSTLFEGDTDVSLYLRFSSERQREQSIEGQLRDCRTFCKLNSYRITAIYVDRATTARKDVEKRVHFQEMIRDSEKKPWEYVVVWKLDRFARNRTDSALFKFRLRKNGVKVISATENISEKPEGIILEAVLEGMAEFYSADLSQKITRGMRESALKCHSIGGHVPLGYKIEDHKLVINPATAHIVREAFELYANGETVADICRMFNTKGYRTAKGVEFNRNSFKSMFRNKRYIGVYTYKDIEMEGGVPAIIDKELFETVSRRLSKNAEAPARGKAKVDYLLAGKLFCGHCGGSMNGESGTSRTGVVHNYYTCYTRKRKHACEKKPLKKEWIEYIVAQDAMELLTDDTIQELADMAISQTEKDLRENTRIPELTERMKETESGIANITNAIEKGIASDALMNRLVELEKEKKNLLRLLTEEEKYVCKIERSQIVYWLTEFKGGRIEDERYRRIIIDLMVNSVTVWDEPDGFRITTAYNLTSCKSKTFRIDPSSEKGFGFEGSKSTNKKPRSLNGCGVFLVFARAFWLTCLRITCDICKLSSVKTRLLQMLIQDISGCMDNILICVRCFVKQPIIYGGTFSFLFPLYVLGCLSCGPSSPSTIDCLIVRISPSRQSHVRPMISDVRRPSQTARRKGNSKSVPLQSVTTSLTRTSVCSLPSFFLSSPKR